jgi:hypothetical protein
MIFNTRKIIKKTLGDLVLHIKPLDAMQQAEVLDLLTDCETTKRVVEVAEIAIGYAIDKVEGLFDEDGKPIETLANCRGLSVETLKQIIDEIIIAGNLEESYSKK